MHPAACARRGLKSHYNLFSLFNSTGCYRVTVHVLTRERTLRDSLVVERAAQPYVPCRRQRRVVDDHVPRVLPVSAQTDETGILADYLEELGVTIEEVMLDEDDEGDDTDEEEGMNSFRSRRGRGSWRSRGRGVSASMRSRPTESGSAPTDESCLS